MEPCECKQDGYCRRYQRFMGGRMRELCSGVNVDIGTATYLREQWKREVKLSVTNQTSLIPLLLKTDQAPGDALVMTAAIRSLHKAYPGKYLIAVESYWPDIFLHSPDVFSHLLPGARLVGMTELCMHYPAVHESNTRGIHFMQGWCEFLGEALGVKLPLLVNRPILHFSDPTPSSGDYWLVCSGGKKDFTTKLWGHQNYQDVVSILRGAVQFIQVGGAHPIVPWRPDQKGSQDDYHPPLNGVCNMVGDTSLRELFNLCRAARGVLCGVSLLMHVAAALEKPAVIIAGGREPVQWNAYPNQQYIHTVGALPCHDNNGHAGGACWRSRVTSLPDDNYELNRNLCERPLSGSPECMHLIRPAHVAEIILRYNHQHEYTTNS